MVCDDRIEANWYRSYPLQSDRISCRWPVCSRRTFAASSTWHETGTGQQLPNARTSSVLMHTSCPMHVQPVGRHSHVMPCTGCSRPNKHFWFCASVDLSCRLSYSPGRLCRAPACLSPFESPLDARFSALQNDQSIPELPTRCPASPTQHPRTSECAAFKPQLGLKAVSKNTTCEMLCWGLLISSEFATTEMAGVK